MHYLLNVSGIVTAAIGLALVAPGAHAQENTTTLTCQNVGGGAPEPLGDRDGHSISVEEYSCGASSGPLSGGVWTGSTIWQWDKANAVMVLGNGVIRKPDATAVYQEKEGKIALKMADGKVTGWAASGAGSWVIAVGSAAPLAGKSYTWTSKPIGPEQFMVEVRGE
jgi:hypothetical protein